MPTYKAIILNKEISVSYEEKQKPKLLEAIKAINHKLENYDNLNGKVSDSKLLCFLAIKLQAELLELKQQNHKENNVEKKLQESNNKNFSLNNKIYNISEENEILKKENDLINLELKNIENQIDTIIKLLKKIYDE